MKKALDVLEKITLMLAVVLFVVMVFSISLQIVLRFAFDTGISWAEELARYCFVWLVLLGSAVAMRRGRHMKIDFFINLMPIRLKIVIETVLNISLIIFLLVVVNYGSQLTVMVNKQLSTGLEMRMSIPYLAIPVGCSLILLFLMESMFIGYKASLAELKGGK